MSEEDSKPLDSLVDDDEVWVRTLVSNLILWRSPINTGLWLLVYLLMFFLVQVSGNSLLTLVAVLVLLQLVATTSAIRGAPALKRVGLLPASFDPRVFALRRQMFSAEELMRFTRGCAEIASSWVFEWNDALETRNARKVIRYACLAFGSIVAGLLFSFEVAMFLGVLCLFTIPKAYNRYGESLDDLGERYGNKLDPLLRRFYPMLDAFEPVIGSFEDD